MPSRGTDDWGGTAGAYSVHGVVLPGSQWGRGEHSAARGGLPESSSGGVQEEPPEEQNTGGQWSQAQEGRGGSQRSHGWRGLAQ